LDIRRNTK
jgi:hypothetical protein